MRSGSGRPTSVTISSSRSQGLFLRHLSWMNRHFATLAADLHAEFSEAIGSW